MRVRRGHADPSHKKCPAARQTESATHSTSCTDMVPVPSLTGAPYHADRPPNRSQQHSHAPSPAAAAVSAARRHGSGIRAQPAAEQQHMSSRRDASAPWACRPEPISTQPHARRSRRHTAPAAPTWCLSRRSMTRHITPIVRRIGHSSTAAQPRHHQLRSRYASGMTAHQPAAAD